jgi:hypothetical protein
VTVWLGAIVIVGVLIGVAVGVGVTVGEVVPVATGVANTGVGGEAVAGVPVAVPTVEVTVGDSAMGGVGVFVAGDGVSIATGVSDPVVVGEAPGVAVDGMLSRVGVGVEVGVVVGVRVSVEEGRLSGVDEGPTVLPGLSVGTTIGVGSAMDDPAAPPTNRDMRRRVVTMAPMKRRLSTNLLLSPACRRTLPAIPFTLGSPTPAANLDRFDAVWMAVGRRPLFFPYLELLGKHARSATPRAIHGDSTAPATSKSWEARNNPPLSTHYTFVRGARHSIGECAASVATSPFNLVAASLRSRHCDNRIIVTQVLPSGERGKLARNSVVTGNHVLPMQAIGPNTFSPLPSPIRPQSARTAPASALPGDRGAHQRPIE